MTNDLVVQIFSLLSDLDNGLPDFPTELSERVKTPIPSFQMNDVKQIYKEILVSKDYKTVLNTRQHLFALNQTILNHLAEDSAIISDFYCYNIKLVFFSFMFWLLQREMLPDQNIVLPLAKSLLNLAKITSFSNHLRTRPISLSCFYEIITFVFDTFFFEKYQPFLELIREFFVSFNNFVPSYFFILKSAMYSMVSPNSLVYPEEVKHLYALIGYISQEGVGLFPQECAEMIISRQYYPISKLNIDSLSLLSSLVPHVSDEFLVNVVSLIPNAIVTFITENEIYYNLPNDRGINKTKLKFASSSQANYVIQDIPTFKCGVNLKPAIAFPEHLGFEYLLDRRLIDVLSLIIKSIKANEKASILMLDSFLMLVKNSGETKYFITLTFSFLYFCNCFRNLVNTASIITFLLSSPYFDPTSTIFDEDPDFKTISSIRQIIIDIITYHGGSFLDIALSFWAPYPNLFAEIVHRIIRAEIRPKYEQKIINSVSKALMSISLGYQTASLSKENSPEIETARTSLLLLISHILSDHDDSYQFFSCIYFVSFFFSLAFENSLRWFVFSHLLSFLSKPNDFIPQTVISTISQVVNISISMISDDSYVILLSDLIRCLNDAITHQRGISSSFSTIHPSIVSSLSSMTKSPPSKSLILQIIRFLSLTVPHKSLSVFCVNSLTSIIPEVFEDEIPSVLTNQIKQLIAGKCLASIQPSFIIGQPNAIRLLFDISSSEDFILDSIDFLDSLVVYSLSNAFLCHESELDLKLLDIMMNHRNGNKELVTKIIALFDHIVSKVSSVAVVHRFIALLSPINGRYLSKNHISFLECLNSILATSLRFPIASIPIIDKNCVIEIEGIDGQEISNGFTFVFWAFIDPGPSQYKPSVLNLSDSQKKRLIFFFSGGSLYITQRTTAFESTGRIDMELPKQSWVFITITYENIPSQDQASIYSEINLVEAKRLDFIPMDISAGQITATMGGLQPDSCISEQAIRIGSFGLYKILTKNEIRQVYELGPRPKKSIISNCLFSYSISNTDGDFQLDGNYVASPITHNINSSIIKAQHTFCEALIRFCKVEMLLPLFSQLDIPVYEERESRSMSKWVVELIGNGLIQSSDAQESFYNANGFSIISFLLQSTSERNIDYGLYMRFVSLIQFISNKQLMEALFHNVLLNLSIWIRCDYDNHIRILRHWSRVLFPSYQLIISRVMPLKRLFSLMRVFYWFQPVDYPQIVSDMRIRTGNFSLSECRQNIITSSLSIAIVSFDDNDLQSLLSHCITISDENQVTDLLTFLRDIGVQSPETLKYLPSIEKLSSFLFSLISRNNEFFIKIILEIIINFHHNGIIKDSSLFEVLLCFMHQVSTSSLSESLYYLLFDRMNKDCPELLSFVSWTAFHTSKLEHFILNLNPSSSYCIHQNWAMWPIIVIFRTNSSNRELFLRFLVLCSSSSWMTLYSTTHLIGLLLKEDSSDIKMALLMSMANSLASESVSPSSVKVFFTLCKGFLFYRNNKECNHALMRVFIDSKFNSTSENDFFFNESKIGLLHPIDIASFFMNTIPETEIYHFGIRLTQAGEWADQIFASFCLSLFCRFSSRQYLGLDLLICGFLIKYFPDMVIQHLKSLNISQEEENSYAPFINLINYHALKQNIESVFHLKDSKMYESAFLCLQKLHVLMDNEIYDSILSQFFSIKTFLTNQSQVLLQFFSSFPDSIISESLSQMTEIIEEMKLQNSRNGRKWSTLWHNLAADRAPWNYSLSEEIHFKRDRTSCISLCPFKLKRNWNFDNHQEASYARDIGSRLTAEQKAEKDREIRMKKYKETGPLELLEIKEEVNASVSHSPIYMQQPHILTIPCKIVSPKGEKVATYVFTKTYTQLEYPNGKTKVIIHTDLQNIFFRRRFHRPNSMEIFTIYGQNYFIHFPKHASLPIISRYSTIPTPNIKNLQTRDFFSFFRTNGLTDAWVMNLMSNFEYIMHLNIMSGRTFNDLSQYPVFPWIVADYQSTELPINKENAYRDLSAPIGATEKNRLNDILIRMPDLVLSGESMYLYGSGFSCPLSVCLFMIRLEPFTQQHIDLQSGRFDHPSRIFASIESAYKMVTNHINDYREMIPEFFFLPEILLNKNHYDLGEGKKGKIGDVDLPKWTTSAYEYVYLHRKLLESEFISKNIHQWIDLIWGYKQRGNEALLSNNLYRPEMYDDAWNGNNINDPRRIAEIEATLCHVGQIPPQLFRSEHPSKKIDLSHQSPIHQPCVIKIGSTGSVVLSRIDRGEDNFHFMVSLANSKGMVFACIIDFTSETLFTVKKRQHRFSLSSKDDQINDNSMIHRSHSSLDMSNDVSDLITVSESAISVHSKEIKGFSDLKVDSSLYPHSVAELPKGKFLAIDQLSKRPIIVNFRNSCLEHVDMIKSDAVCLTANTEYCSIAGTDAVLSIFRQQRLHMSMPSYRDSISCCNSSTTFHLVVIGTKDGFLIINSLSSGSTVKVIDLRGLRPLLVNISNSWGFIMVYATSLDRDRPSHVILLYNVNGDFIREKHIDFRVSYWYTWSSLSDFDYAIIADERGNLFSFEVFYLNISDKFFRCREQISSLKYFWKIETVVLTTTDGRIVFIPHTIK